MAGKLYIAGIGPGDRGNMSFRLQEVLDECEVVVGYTLYIRLIEPYIRGKEIISTGMRAEIERCQEAIRRAGAGARVVLVSSGDPGIYGMSGLVFELLDKSGETLEVEVIPGITALSSSAALLGAPLMHDFASISLSDLMTPWETIERRIRLAAEGDFVLCLYNPLSRTRREGFTKAVNIIARYRAPETPVGLARNNYRPGEETCITTLGALTPEGIDMLTTVVIGNSMTYVSNGRMVTPRGYQW